MKSYFNCSLFEEELVVCENFQILQKELQLKKIQNNKASFNVVDVVYKCRWNKNSFCDKDKPSILIPIKDNIKLIKTTISNLVHNNIHNKANIIIIDDRSTKDIEKVVSLYEKVSYLRIDNEKGFNFSMLNNIAAKICYELGNNTVIFWNSDLWCPKENYYDDLVKLHIDNNCVVSGTKLVYPPLEFSLNGEIDSDNIKKYFPKMTDGKWRETIQFGGGTWYGGNSHHFKRFAKIDDKFVDCNRITTFITGAFQIWNLKHFIELGGFNPSLSKNFQDGDLMLKCLESDICPVYFGKDLFMYHDESLTLMDENKEDKQMNSDAVLFHKVWFDKIFNLVC